MAAEPYIGDIVMVGFNFAPRGWAICDGSLLNINEYEALFALLGTTYGGDGRTTFALPDLRGRFPLGAGAGTNLTPYNLGETGGVMPVQSNVDYSTGRTDVLSGLPPFLAVNFIIAVFGVFPSRS